MDVTTQIRKQNLHYGGSRSNNPRYASAQKSMNITDGNNINNPILLPTVTSVPFRFEFNDVIGLPGAENKFYKADFNLMSVNGCYEDPLWECANVIFDDYDDMFPGAGSWDPVEWSYNKDIKPIYQDYEPVRVNNDLPNYVDPMASIQIINRGTGNQYVDKWIDVRLYDKDNQERPSDYAFAGLKSSVTFAIHCRNTKQLPHQVAVIIGKQFVPGNLVRAVDRI